ncbi:TPA: hypothetical protein N0F65_002264 [Lagenidium giganteum]|uniref:Uncharacterized protein n=1 Tax=Lagenidium giganteum TaxID=4803 RepID=A0AAV2YNS5_9STRA|nr:TPA: hypothetical protein N0F65_002264 [Lagenidium giganteum]
MVSDVSGHGILLAPAAKVKPNSVSKVQMFDFVGEIDGTKAYPGRRWYGFPEQNQKELVNAFAQTGVQNLRTFLQNHERAMITRHRGQSDNVCGFTDVNVQPMDLPADGNLLWGHSGRKWGFQATHRGPCETWCDDELVQSNPDCLGAYGAGFPAKVPIDVAKCRGKKTLRFMWLAVHFSKWQYWRKWMPDTKLQ